jgi:chaperonin cofactor prefoldin
MTRKATLKPILADLQGWTTELESIPGDVATLEQSLDDAQTALGGLQHLAHNVGEADAKSELPAAVEKIADLEASIAGFQARSLELEVEITAGNAMVVEIRQSDGSKRIARLQKETDEDIERISEMLVEIAARCQDIQLRGEKMGKIEVKSGLIDADAPWKNNSYNVARRLLSLRMSWAGRIAGLNLDLVPSADTRSWFEDKLKKFRSNGKGGK